VDNFHSELIKSCDTLGKEVIHKDEGKPDYGFTEGVLEIHGNWLYMRCSNESGHCPSNNHFYNFPKIPTKDELIRGDFCVP